MVTTLIDQNRTEVNIPKSYWTYNEAKHKRVYELRMSGLTYEEIGKKLKVTKQRAERMYKTYLKKNEGKVFVKGGDSK